PPAARAGAGGRGCVRRPRRRRAADERSAANAGRRQRPPGECDRVGVRHPAAPVRGGVEPVSRAGARMNLVRRALLAGAISLSPTPVWAQGAETDSVVYVLSAASRFEVKTGKAGLFGFAGHAHVIRARGVTGRVVYHPNAPAESRVEIVVPADSLEVVTPPDTAEIRKVTEAMRTEVLHTDQYPEMLFASRTLTAAEGGFRLTAALTMAGHTRPVSIDLRVTIVRDTIRATPSFDVNQTDFGIRPFRGGPGGTVRVADKVTFTIA